MMLSAALLALCAIVIVVGATAELVEALQVRRREAVGGTPAVRTRVVAELDTRSILAWLGVAAVAVLGPAVLGARELEVADLALAVLVLGFAAERGAYLVRRLAVGDRRAFGTAAVAVLAVAAGLLMGFGV